MKIWQEAMILVKDVYSLTNDLPTEERFGLISQVNRCAVSIPSNIAEGSGRTSEKEFIHFLRIAISSSYELETQLILMKDIYKVESEEILIKLSSLQNRIGAFIRKINENV
ncbi:MAG: four helix bundle protein [Crocinitomicaceae bacterium]|nr:four helix bundle protein [Crocinitomicaceae bacterium]